MDDLLDIMHAGCHRNPRMDIRRCSSANYVLHDRIYHAGSGVASSMNIDANIIYQMQRATFDPSCTFYYEGFFYVSAIT